MPSYAPTTTAYSQGNLTWLRTRKGMSTALTVTLDTSAFTAGTHYPNGYFPAGLVLGKITASGMYGPYNNALSNGQEVAAGFLLNDEQFVSTSTDIPTAMLTECDVVEARLPSGNGLDSAAKTDFGARCTFV